MDGHQEATLRTSFGGAAAAYAQHRPGYAYDAVRWAISAAPGPRVLDLGAGTGKLTAALVAVGAEAVAVEPDPAMLVELRRAHPLVDARAGSAETIPLPDASVDAVLAGHALHWFDMAVAGREIARVLAPGGVLAGLWNVVDDRVGWVAELARAGGAAALGPRDLLSSWPSATSRTYLPRDDRLAAAFGSPEVATFAHPRLDTADSLLARIATHAGLLVMPADERAATLARLSAVLAAHPETATGEFTWPMQTAVLRVHPL